MHQMRRQAALIRSTAEAYPRSAGRPAGRTCQEADERDIEPLVDLILEVKKTHPVGWPKHVCDRETALTWLLGEAVLSRLVWTSEGRIVGHGALKVASEAAMAAVGRMPELHLEICQLFVSESVRRSGLGREALHTLSQQASSLGGHPVAQVRADNGASRHLLESCGMRRAGSRHVDGIELLLYM